MNSIEKEKLQQEIIDWANRCFKEIDESPFIMKKNSLLWRLAGGKMSQADYMKTEIRLKARLMIIDLELASRKEQNEL